MDSEVYSFALKSTLNEIQNICPDVKSVFMFKDDGEVLAADERTPEHKIVQVVDALDSVMEKADVIGGLECIIIESTGGRMHLSRMNDVFLVTVTSKSADMNYVNTVTRVLVPTILRLLEKISPTAPAAPKSNPSRFGVFHETPAAKVTEEPEEEEELVEETAPKEPERHVEREPERASILDEPQANQFIVENIGGLLVPSDTVRIDNSIIEQWCEQYEDRKIEDVEVETFGGSSTRCKVKPIKDSKYEGKGIIQMPDKIQVTLDIKKGELVRVKPVLE